MRAEARSCLLEAEGRVGDWQVRYLVMAWPNARSADLEVMSRDSEVLWDNEMASSGWRRLVWVFLAKVSRVWICLVNKEAWAVSRLIWGERREVQTGRREGADCARHEERRHWRDETQAGGQPDRNNDKYVEHFGAAESLAS